MYLESLRSAALHSNGLLNQGLAGPSKLVLAWRGILQTVWGAHQRVLWPHCSPSLSTEVFFPKTWQLFLLGQSEFVPQLEFWFCLSLFECWRINSYLGVLFSTSTLDTAICPWKSTLTTYSPAHLLGWHCAWLLAGQTCSKGRGFQCTSVWRDGCEGWGRKRAWKEKSYRKLLFLALSPVSGSWPLTSADPGLSL